jgi:hypothetical protein
MDIHSPVYSSVFTHTFIANLEEEISDISSISTFITMSDINSSEQCKTIADLNAGLEKVKLHAASTNTLVGQIAVSADILYLHKQLTLHKLIFT